MLRFKVGLTVLTIILSCSALLLANGIIDEAELILQAARNSVKAGEFPTAAKRFERYLGIRKDNAQAALELMELLLSINQPDKADEICQKTIVNVSAALEANPENHTYKLDLAHLYRWRGKFSTASGYYTAYLAAVPEDEIAMLEQARLEGWDLNYGKSERCYKKLVEKFPDDLSYKYEYLAKKYNWLGWNIKATDNYLQAKKIKPEDVEILYDLGQIYDRRGMYAKADAMYQKVLHLSPNHSMAHKSRMTEEYRKKQYLRLGTQFTRKKGRDDNVDFDSYRVDLKYSPERALGGGEITAGGGYSYLDVSGKAINANFINAGYDHLFGEAVNLTAKAEFTNYSRQPHQTFQYDARIKYQPHDFIGFAVFSGQQDLNENIDIMCDELSRHYLGSQIIMIPFTHCQVDINAKKHWYSDGNCAYEYEGVAEYKILKYPHILKAILRHYGFSAFSERDDYWTPDDYNMNSAGLGWYHYLNKYHYADLYYYLQGHCQIDRSGNRGQEFVAGFVFDNKQAFNCGLEYSAVFSSVYDQGNVRAFLQYRW